MKHLRKGNLKERVIYYLILGKNGRNLNLIDEK